MSGDFSLRNKAFLHLESLKTTFYEFFSEKTDI